MGSQPPAPTVQATAGACTLLASLIYSNLLAARLLHHGREGLSKTVVAGLLGCIVAFLCLRRLPRVRHAAWRAGLVLGLLFVPVAVAVKSPAASVVSPWWALAAWLLAGLLLTSRAAPPIASGALALLATMGAITVLDALHALRRPDVRTGWVPEPFLIRDESMGYVPVANYEGRAFRRVSDQESYDVKVTTDRFSRRITPDSPERFACHAMFMGCSFVFGEGVNDWETLPAWFAALTNGCRVYNYGLGGYGPQHVLKKLESGELPRAVPESRGILVYCLQPFHVDRAIGSYIFLKWGRFSPCYTLRGGHLAANGSFDESHRAWVRAVDLLRASPTADRVATRIDLRLSYAQALGYRRAIPLTVAIIAEAARRYRQQFDGRLLVVIWPNHDDRSGELEAGCAAHGVPAINLLREGLGVPGEDDIVRLDGHPNGDYYRRAATILRRVLAHDLEWCLGESSAP